MKKRKLKDGRSILAVAAAAATAINEKSTTTTTASTSATNNNVNKKKRRKKIDKKKGAYPDEGLQGLLLYIRNLYKNQWLPSKNNKREVYTTYGVGTASIKNRIVMKGNKLRQHIDRYFPQGHIHYTDSPQTRALHFKPPDQQSLFMMTDMNKKNEWNKIEMAQAAREFKVPAA